MEEQVIRKLKFSYYRLSEELQKCLNFCALYPKAYKINREELVWLLIFEGTIQSAESLLSAYDYGCTLFNKLMNVCLLMQGPIDVADEVVMHDLVRDMCLDIVGDRFLVKCHSKFPPNESEYTKDVEKVSLIGSEFVEIPSHAFPYCPNLSTFLLFESKNLTRISSAFFLGLPNLQFLDLSDTSIHEVPNSITNLVCLNALVVRRCFRLKHLPCLAPLKRLKKLDLQKSGIEEAPEGLGELVHLIYLDLDETRIRRLPRQVLQKLVKLQILNIGMIKITIDEVKELTNLEWFQGTFANLQEFNEYVSSLLNSKGGPSVYEFRVFCGLMSYGIYRNVDGMVGISFLGEKNRINSTKLMFPDNVKIIIPSHELVEFLSIHRFEDDWHVLCKLERVASSSLHMLPICFHRDEEREGSDESKGLFDARFLLQFSNLKRLFVCTCTFIEELISTSPSAGVLNSLLEFLIIHNCSKLVRLLNPKFLSCFQFLQSICIGECVSLESIISPANPIEKEESENAVTFPNLRHLVLFDLPNLRSIYDGICPSIENIHVRRCPKLKRLPLQLPVLDDNSEQSVPLQSSLVVICGEPTWWESLEWDHPRARSLLQPYFRPCLDCYADNFECG